MKRITFLWVIFLLAAPATVAFAAAAERGAGVAAIAGSGVRGAGMAAFKLPRSHLDGFFCHTSYRPRQRSVSIRAVMRPVTGTEKMQMRFELLSRSSPAAASVAQPGSGLGSWLSPPDPTLGQRSGDEWIVPDLVRNLPAPALYRYRVSFRWTGSRGRVLATRTRTSGDCFQPLYHPDLLVSSIAIQQIPGDPTKDQYVATIANQGLAPATGPFSVTLTPSASRTPGATPVASTRFIRRLDIGASRAVTFVGPACTALTAPTVVVNPDHAVTESGYTNNLLVVNPSCPALTSTAILGQ